jgi:DNA-binding beta-propeller fold protein YncE
MSQPNPPKRVVFAVTGIGRARRTGAARVAFLAAALALMLPGCGSRSVPQPPGASGRPSPPGGVVYVVTDTPPGLIPVDLAHRTTGRPIPLPGGNPEVGVTPDGRTAYVMVRASLVPIDLITGAHGHPIDVPAGASGPWMAPGGRTAYVLDGRVIIPVDLRTGTAGRGIIVPDLSVFAFSIAAGGRAACLIGSTITASGLGEHQVLVPVNLAAGTAGKPVSVPGLLEVALTPDGRTAYAASGNTLLPIDLATGKTGRPVRLPMMPGIGAIAVTADGHTAYVGNLKPEKPPYGVVVPIDLTTLTTQPPIRVLSYPFSITAILITPDGRTAAAAANTAVIPIDLQTRKASKPIRVPAGSAIGLLP